MAEATQDLRKYLALAREALVWKLDGLSEYDVRRPLVPTGTNLLGLIKHSAGVEAGYLGDVFGRPFPEALPWMGPVAEPNADMWASADESRADIIGLFMRVAAHSEATFDALGPDAVGHVPWWPDDRSTVTLNRIAVHVLAELHRHAGHADIIRELIDGSAGLRASSDNFPTTDRAWWSEYVETLEAAAVDAEARSD